MSTPVAFGAREWYVPAAEPPPEPPDKPGTGVLVDVSDDPAGLLQPDPADPGYCYLAAYRADVRARPLAKLGFNPWLLDLQSDLQDNPGDWARACVTVTYGVAPLQGDGRAFCQAHLSPSQHGLGIRDLLDLHAARVRVGADLRLPTSSEAPAVGHSALTVASRAPSLTIRWPFAAVLRPQNVAAFLVPRTNPQLIAATKFYESVEIVGFEMSLSVSGGSQASVSFGIGPVGSGLPSTEADFLRLATSVSYSGDDGKATTGDFHLRPDHGFGAQIKGVSLGTPDPAFFWRATAEDDFRVTLRGSLTLCVSGTAPVGPALLSTVSSAPATPPPATT